MNHLQFFILFQSRFDRHFVLIAPLFPRFDHLFLKCAIVHCDFYDIDAIGVGREVYEQIFTCGRPFAVLNNPALLVYDFNGEPFLKVFAFR